MSHTWDFELFVGGRWTSEDTTGVIDVIDPATEDRIGGVPEATVALARRAITAARTAFDDGPWPWMKPAERADKLVRMAEHLEAKATDLRELIVTQTGSVGMLTDAVQAGGSIAMFRSNATLIEHGFEWVENQPPTASSTGMAGTALVREPIGVVGAITPFNFPFMLNVVKVAPALAAGCTVVLKPHPWTPLDAMLIAEAAAEADLPPGVLNVISGHAEIGNELVSSPLVDMITFTGSTATGRQIMATAAPTVKKLALELGGKSAQVVLDDVDEEHARTIGFAGVLGHCGQACVAQTRLILPAHLLDAYLDGVTEQFSNIRIGDPRDPSTTLGPLIRDQQRERVEAYVASAHEEGARLICGGRRPAELDRGFFFEPTVFVGGNDLRIAQEEIFGPVLTVIPYEGGDDVAVRLANDTIYGLGGGVVAARTDRAFDAARRIRAGLVTARGVHTQPRESAGPGAGQGPGWGMTPQGIGQSGAFGGYKQSGLGREWGHHGIAEFTEVKSLSWM